MTSWPDGKTFAFTVFDDTDFATLPKNRVVYDFLADLGLRTTKSVWPIAVDRPASVGGATCADDDYAAWAVGLQDEGFEIGLHGVTFTTADREEIATGLDRFRDLFGHDPACHANHADARDGLYWGPARLSGAHRLVHRAACRGGPAWEGHVPGSRHFWGDLSRERVGYVRNFVLGDINTFKACPEMPYHDPDRPFVNAWFASSEGARCSTFVRTVSEAAQDRLEEEGGACIMYTHFASGFVDDRGRLDPTFARLMRRLSEKPGGWFVPVGTLLDHLRRAHGTTHVLTPSERRRLERSWLRHKVVTRGTA